MVMRALSRRPKAARCRRTKSTVCRAWLRRQKSCTAACPSLRHAHLCVLSAVMPPCAKRMETMLSTHATVERCKHSRASRRGAFPTRPAIQQLGHAAANSCYMRSHLRTWLWCGSSTMLKDHNIQHVPRQQDGCMTKGCISVTPPCAGGKPVRRHYCRAASARRPWPQRGSCGRRAAKPP